MNSSDSDISSDDAMGTQGSIEESSSDDVNSSDSDNNSSDDDIKEERTQGRANN